jgi:putative DNA primase/helicase
MLRNKHGPCPCCGGTDRYRFDNRRGRGDFICGQCGAGDGFALLKRLHGWEFTEARKRVMAAAGFGSHQSSALPIVPAQTSSDPPATPNDRVRRLLRSCCPIVNSNDAVTYLASRGLWPLPADCALRAHAGADYWNESRRLGRFSALVAQVVDIAGELVTTHVTYLQDGQKLTEHEPRKILSPMTGREGCAVRLMPGGEVLGIAEGLETALSAAILDAVPVWAALNATLLAKFEPPPGVRTLRVYADRDEAGLAAALKLAERLQGRIAFEVRIPPAPAKDWNDVLTRKAQS